ncbi:hypothetical protein FG93_01191 [Bosea sp. LC85]|nr:hypothetical protein FG93_01191 [Bosea sp. LC85]
MAAPLIQLEHFPRRPRRRMAPVCGLPAEWRAIIRQPGGICFARRGATISEARTLRAIAVRHFDEGAEPSPCGRSSECPTIRHLNSASSRGDVLLMLFRASHLTVVQQ